MNAGDARIELHTTLQVIDEAPNLKFDQDDQKVEGLHACFERAAEVTGSSPLSLKRLFWSHFKTDGADSVDNASLYKVRPDQTAAISAFVKFANSSQGAAKVSPIPKNPPQL